MHWRKRNKSAGFLSRAPSRDRLTTRGDESGYPAIKQGSAPRGFSSEARGEGPEVFYPYDDKEVAAVVFAILVFGVPPIGITFLLIGYLIFFS